MQHDYKHYWKQWFYNSRRAALENSDSNIFNFITLAITALQTYNSSVLTHLYIYSSKLRIQTLYLAIKTLIPRTMLCQSPIWHCIYVSAKCMLWVWIAQYSLSSKTIHNIAKLRLITWTTECSERRLIGCARSVQKVLSADTVGSHGKLKVIHLVITRSSESVNVTPSTATEASFCCALFCIFMARVRLNFEQRVYIYDCYVGKNNSYKSCRRKFHLEFGLSIMCMMDFLILSWHFSDENNFNPFGYVNS
jgi:hypothetical protein